MHKTMTKKTAELVFIPTPGAGHLVSMVEIAKKLVDRNDRLSVTILIITLPEFDAKPTNFAQSLTASDNNSSSASRIKFVNLPDDEDEENEEPGKQKAPRPLNFFFKFIESRKPYVKEVVNKLITESAESPDSPRLAGFVLDMFCTCMIDVAEEFNVPSYLFFTSGAAFLGFMLHVQGLRDEGNLETTELKDSDAEVKLPCMVNSVPARVWPSSFTNEEMVDAMCDQVRRYRDAKGIIVNTFEELESYAVKSFSDGKAMSKIPNVYAVGPLLNIDGHNYNMGPGGADRKAEIMTWLDDQPDSSVVFLCFGSRGSFGEEQVKEIAWALEQSGFRFLWSLRRAPAKDNPRKPTDYDDFTDVLPEGFLDRTACVEKVTGWAPQVAVLSHPAVGGFVSHCGWNSTLESLWFGVPMATWPLYAEQQFNAFELVVELGLAVEIKMDYFKDFTVENPTIVSAQVIEGGIRCLMEHGSEVRMKVKEMSEKGRKALLDGGSSFRSMGRLIDDVMNSL